MADESIYDEMKKAGVSRRNFMKFCGVAAGAIGLTALPPLEGVAASALAKNDRLPVSLVAKALENKPRLPVIWLEFQDCAGCSEALTRSQSP
nr:twin-arginine translocation signal domain-containing protein [Anaerolinea sp.]